MNLFDNMRDVAFDITTTTFGKQATWTPIAGGATKTAQVNFNAPDHVKKLGDAEFLPTDATLEYRIPLFPGLKESSDNGETEVVVVESVEYDVRFVKALHDGNTLIAVIQKKL